MNHTPPIGGLVRLLVTLSFVPFAAAGQPGEGKESEFVWHDDLAQARMKARAKGKPLMIYVFDSI